MTWLRLRKCKPKTHPILSCLKNLRRKRRNQNNPNNQRKNRFQWRKRWRYKKRRESVKTSGKPKRKKPKTKTSSISNKEKQKGKNHKRNQTIKMPNGRTFPMINLDRVTFSILRAWILNDSNDKLNDTIILKSCFSLLC